MAANQEMEAALLFDPLRVIATKETSFCTALLWSIFGSDPGRSGLIDRRLTTGTTTGMWRRRTAGGWQVLVYKRFEDRLVVEPLEKLYREVWEPLNNFFCRV